MTDKQLLGKRLFSDTDLSSPDGQSCLSCHEPAIGFVDPDVDLPTSEGVVPLRVGFRNAPTVTYHATAPDFHFDPDFGAYIGGHLKNIGEPPEVYGPQLGKFGMPTLRNIALTAPYFHNGFFKDMKTVVHFFNTRDVPEEGWPPPEVPVNVSRAVGNLGLTDEEEDAVVAFLMTLTDGFKP
ncbi:MAG: c-type cytochrome [Armatimonadetes bacterium]|nr:c-type cytochrome [Armatimonadota bacterium]